MMLYRILLTAGLSLSALSFAPALSANSLLAQSDASTSRAAEAAIKAYGGKVLSVEKDVSDGRTLYRVKLLLGGGRIKIVTIDGETGRAV